MKSKLKELDVDFVGGQDPLTREEEKAISDFFRKQKEARKPKKLRITRKAARKVK